MNYSRVGLRVSFIRDFETQEMATAAVLSTGHINAPEHAQFGVGGKPAAAHYSIRREDGKNGFTLWLKAESLKFELQPTFGLGPYMKPLDETRHRVTLEVDSFLMAQLSVSQMLVRDWISQTYHIIRRDSNSFVGGL
jgi:hypothetical protein